MMGVYTVVCVPLFVDWEEIFWSSYDIEKEPEFQNAHGEQSEQANREDQHFQEGVDGKGDNSEMGHEVEDNEEAKMQESAWQSKGSLMQAFSNEALFIEAAWRKSKILFSKFTLLFLLEHLIFLLPLVDLKVAINHR